MSVSFPLVTLSHQHFKVLTLKECHFNFTQFSKIPLLRQDPYHLSPVLRFFFNQNAHDDWCQYWSHSKWWKVTFSLNRSTNVGSLVKMYVNLLQLDQFKQCSSSQKGNLPKRLPLTMQVRNRKRSIVIFDRIHKGALAFSSFYPLWKSFCL